MSATIEVQQEGKDEFQVRVIEGGSETLHRVTVKPADYRRLAGGNANVVELVRKSFEFLLKNEPKESILRRFDLSVIGQYFPNYESEIRAKF